MFGSRPSASVGRGQRRKYRSGRAVPPSARVHVSSHMVTQWTRIKLAILLVGAMLLALLMLTPIALLELPDSSNGNTKSGNVPPPKHVGLMSLMHKSQEIRNNWKEFVKKEEMLMRQELEKDLPRFFGPKREEYEEKRIPKHTPPPQTQPEEDEQETEELGRGVAGLPMAKTPALVGAKRGHIENCEKIPELEDLVYWNDPQGDRDRGFESPFAYTSEDEEMFLSFEPDMGGWNNVRMSFENIVVLASATGRTLVLPPKVAFYLLSSFDKEDGARNFASFYNWEKDDDFRQHVKMISMTDFLKRHGTSLLGMKESDLEVIQPVAERCIQVPGAKRHCKSLYKYFREKGHQPPIQAMKDCIIFDKVSYQKSEHGESNGNFTPPLAIGSANLHLMQRTQRFCGPERHPLIYTQKTWSDHRVIHFQSELKYRMLNHFYTFMHFTDPVIDNFYKRFIRDHLHYKDEIYCATGKVMHALRKDASEIQGSSTPTYAAFHVRRGDFQYKETRLSVHEWYNNTKDLLREGEPVYISTDEKDKSFFEPLVSEYGLSIKFLDDYWDVAKLESLDPSYTGMVDAIVASQGRIFVGTWFSTFSGYINRLRGYAGFSMKDSWYSWPPRRTRVQEWQYPTGNYPAREWPIAWSGIDGDEWIEHETDGGKGRADEVDEKTAEYELEKEAGLGGDEEDQDKALEEDESVTKVAVREVPRITLEELEQDTHFVDKPMARGVAGRPSSETPALLGGSRAHVQCDINVDSLAYWNDPQGDRDIHFRSPFAVPEGVTKYISFAPDRGGWNNVRMSMEIIFIIALATGRTLVLPPEIKLYLLHHDKGKKHRSFADFFPLHSEEFNKRVPVITMEEFIKREGGTSGRAPLPTNNQTLRGVLVNAASHCDNRRKSTRSCMAINEFLEKAGYHPKFRAQDGCIVFDEDVFAGSPISDASKASAEYFCGERNITYITPDFQETGLIHFHANDKKYRLLTHFYSMIHFTNPALDNYIKRFVRDLLHYHDTIYCAAGKIVKALQAEGKKKGFPADDEGAGGYSAMHIRRGDFQYKNVKLPARLWYNNTKELWKPHEILYIATDERNKSWFDPIVARHAEVRFLDDYWELAGLSNVDPNYMGMIDTIVASRARVFAGTWFSTFSGYINRMRGYHGMSMQDSWYSFMSRKTALHEWNNVDHYAYAYEWPTGWVGIDADTVPSKDKF